MFEKNAGLINESRKDGRRVPAHEKKNSFTLKNIQDIHHQIKRMLFLGMSNVQIANKLNVTPVMVTQIKNSPVIQQQLKLMHAAADKETLDLQAQIAEIAPKALENIKDVVEFGELRGEAVKANTIIKESNNLLDRHMGKATQTIKGVHAHAHFTADDLKQLKEDARDAGGDVINLVPEDK